MPDRYDIPKIVFNGHACRYMEVTDSAQKHFGANAERYFRYVVSYLDGQVWKPAEFGKDGSAEYMTASCTMAVKYADAESDYRETWFRVRPDEDTLEFFHGSSIRRAQYDKALHKMRLQSPED